MVDLGAYRSCDSTWHIYRTNSIQRELLLHGHNHGVWISGSWIHVGGRWGYCVSSELCHGRLIAFLTCDVETELTGPVFQVMSLLLGVPPILARDFSFCIQSFGMTAASMTILGLQVPVDRESLIWATLGGALGLVFGLVGVAPFLSPPYAKLFFVSVWMTFAMALFKLNARGRDRKVYISALEADQAVISSFSDKDPSDKFADDGIHSREGDCDLFVKEKKQKSARAWILFYTGFFGGICSSVAGSGLDIATFSILTLYYRVSEKVATPTSVVLMAVNAMLGVFCRVVLGLGGAYAPGEQGNLWKFVSVCIPVVVIGAPVGATIASIVARHWLAYFIYVLNTVQFISALAIIKPWSKPPPDNVWLCALVAVITVFGSLFFSLVAFWGNERGECDGGNGELGGGCELSTLLNSRGKSGGETAEYERPKSGMV